MRRLSVPFFTALLAVLVFLALRSFADLPEHLAVHFRSDGTPDRWLNRDDYQFVVLASLVGVPLLVVWLTGGLPRLTKGKGQIPHAAYWFAEERQRATSDFLLGHACWLGCFSVAAIYGLHIILVRANAMTPPSLQTDRLGTMVLLCLVGLAWWFQALLKHFRR